MSRIFAILLLVALVGVLAVLLWLSRPQAVEPGPARPASALRAAAPASAASGGSLPSSSAAPPPEWPKQELAVWFEGGDSLLHRQTRSVPVPPGPTGRIRASVGAMFSGPGDGAGEAIANWPAGSSVRAVFLAPPGVVTIDLDIAPELLAGWGTHQEWMALQGLAATILGSAPEGTGGVVVTVRGETPETLAGHLDLTRPIRLDPKLLADEPLPTPAGDGAASPGSSSSEPAFPSRAEPPPASPSPSTASARV